MRNLIDREIVYQHFLREAGHTADSVLMDATQAWVRTHHSGSQDAFSAWMHAQGYSQLDFRKLLAHDLVREQRLDSLSPPGESHWRSFYEAHREDLFTTPARYHAHVIELPVSAKPGEGREEQAARLEEFRRRVAAGEDFNALAREHSRHALALENGHWGWFGANQLAEPYRKAFASLPDKAVSGVFEEKGLLRLCRLVERREAVAQSYEEALPRVKPLVWAQRRDEAWADWMKGMRASAVVVRPGSPASAPAKPSTPERPRVATAEPIPPRAAPASVAPENPDPDDQFPFPRPNPIRGLSGWEEGRDVVVPVEMGSTWPYVRASLNGKDAGWFLVATGWSRSFLSLEKAKELGAVFLGPRADDRTARAGDGVVGQIRVDEWTIGGLRVDTPTLLVNTLENLSMKARGKIAGVLGGDVLGMTPFTLDYPAGTLSFHAAATFRPPAAAHEEPLRILLNSPVVPALVNGAPLNLMVLTDGQDVTLLPGTVKRYPEVSHGPLTRKSPVYVKKTKSSVYVEQRRCRVEALGQTLPEHKVVLGVRNVSDTTEKDGFLGGAFLTRFTITLDYQARRAWFEAKKPVPMAERIRGGLRANQADLDGIFPLQEAIMQGDTDGVEALLRAGADPAVALGHKAQALGTLRLAAEFGDARMARLLLAAGAKANEVQASNGTTPLFAAVWNRDAGVVQALLEARADPNHKADDGMTALMGAAAVGNEPACRLLEAAGGNLRARDQAGMNLLGYALSGGNVGLIQGMLQSGMKMEGRALENVPLVYLPAGQGHWEAADWLIRQGHPVLPGGNLPSPLGVALREGHDKVALRLLEAGADPGWQDHGVTCLMLAAQGASPETLRLLIGKGLEVRALDAHGKSALLYAAEALRPVEVLRVLLEAGADPNLQPLGKEAALWFYIRQGRPAEVRYLLGAGASPESPSAEGLSPLFVAAHVRSLRMVEDLLEAGASVDSTQAKRPLPPLLAAILGESPDIVSILLKRGARRDPPLDQGTTYALVAAEADSPRCLDLLLRSGVDVTSTDQLGNTALHRAARSGSAEVIRMLVDRGAPVDKPNGLGVSPLLVSVVNQNAGAARALLRAGANPRVVDPASRLSPREWALRRKDAALAALFPEEAASPP